MKIISIILALLAITGCAQTSPRYKPLPSASIPEIAGAETVVVVSQKTINSFIGDSNVSALTGGGLLAMQLDAAIVRSRIETAETTIAPIRNALRDFHFNEKLMAVMQAETKNVSWLKDAKTELYTQKSTEALEKRLLASVQPATLFFTINYYSLSSDFSTLMMVAEANLYPNTKELRRQQVELYKDNSQIGQPGSPQASEKNSLYRNFFGYNKKLPKHSKGSETAVNLWTANNGQKIRDALSEGIQALVAMLVEDLNQTSHDPANTKGFAVSIKLNGKTFIVERSPTGSLSLVAD